MSRLFRNRSGTGTGISSDRTTFLPTLTSLTPATGTTAGGTSITLTGTGFRSTAPITTVTVGGAAATSVSVASATSLTCTTPSGTAGDRDVAVRNGDGPSNTLVAGFNYQAPAQSGTVTVTVTLSAVARSGGTATLYSSGGAVIGSGTPNASGQVVFSNLDDGTYYGKLEPRFGDVIASGEPDATSYTYSDARSATVTGGSSVGIAIAVSAAQYYDDFTDYADSADLRSTYPDGVSTDPMDDLELTFGTQHTMDLTGGQAGGATSVVTWPSRPTSGCGADVTYRLAMRFNPVLTSASWYIFWREYNTTPWENGSTSCTGQWEYKHMLTQAGTGNSSQGLLLQHGKGGADPNANLSMRMTLADSNGGVGHVDQPTTGLGLPSGAWPGVWHTHVFEMTGMTGSTPVTRWYQDGTLKLTATLSGATWTGAGQLQKVEFGANLDSGPDQVGQVRKIDRAMVSKTRPALSVL